MSSGMIPSGPLNVEIGLPTRIPSQNPQRAGKFDLIVPYSYGQFNRGAITLPEEGTTRQTIEAAVRAEISKLKDLGGFSMQV
jgi:hypothetical protein